MTEAGKLTLNELSHEVFENYIDDRFHCSAPVETIFKLCEVKTLYKEDNPLVKRQPFSLLFKRSNESTDPAQGIYELSHEKLGEVSLFLVPVDRDSSSTYYEATFT